MVVNAEVNDYLDWLHDCDLQELQYDVSNPDERTLRLELICPEDLGYPPWEGKTLELKAMGVLLFRYTAWGYVIGLESMDAWRVGVSDATQVDLQRLRAS